MIRVLVVDDSPTMRSLITQALRRDPGIEVVGQAADPIEARAAIKALDPDVLTLDIEMPNMNGLDFLERLMRLRPMPVVMVSTLTAAGTEATLEALALGAIDYVSKPAAAGLYAFDGLAAKVRAASGARVRSGPASTSKVAAPPEFVADGKIVAIGASTGGVEALLEVLQAFPADCPPTVITQHMPASFTRSFAARLDRLCAPSVAEAVDGAPLRVGRVYLAPGGERHLEVTGARGALRCRLSDSDPVSGHRPSVDVLFDSVASTVRGHAIGVILTGMGRDGARGLLAMRQAGALTLGQDEASSVIYGMPRAAFETGAVARQVTLDRIGWEILAATGAGDSRAIPLTAGVMR